MVNAGTKVRMNNEVIGTLQISDSSQKVPGMSKSHTSSCLHGELSEARGKSGAS